MVRPEPIEDEDSARVECWRDVSQVAELLDVSPATVQRWCRERRLPHVRIGHTIRFSPAQLASIESTFAAAGPSSEVPYTTRVDEPARDRRLLGSAAVAMWLGVSREQVWRLWATGKLPGYRIDRRLRFASADVESFLASHHVGVATPFATPASRRDRRDDRTPTDYERV